MPHTHLRAIIQELKSQGERITNNRLAVLEYLCEQSRPVSIKQLEQAVRGVNIVTLYRLMEYFEEHGIVQRLTHDAKEQYFELAAPYHRHHHHAICQRCGKITDINCDVSVPVIPNFTPSMHTVTVYGWCKKCPV